MARKRISKTSHGFARNLTDASQEVFQHCSRLACCLLMLKMRDGWPVCVVVGIEEAGVGEIVPMMT